VKRRKVFLWFKDIHNILRTHVAAQVYDTQSAAKLIDEVYTYEIEMDELQSDLAVSTQTRNPTAFGIVLSDMADTMGEAICTALDSEPWRAFVIASTKEQLTLSAGAQAGVKSKAVFDLYGRCDMMAGKEGQRFLMPGEKIGEVEIITVTPQTSEAILISGTYEHGMCGYIQAKP
jgi:hypothetical protein